MRLGSSWVNPTDLRAVPEGWEDPKGFRYPGGELEEVPEQQPDAPIAELPCRREQVYALHPVPGKGQCRWATDVGEFVWDMKPAQAAQLHPDLVLVVSDSYLNRKRLRRVERAGPRMRLTLDNGEFLSVADQQQDEVARRLGLPQLCYLEPRMERPHSSSKMPRNP